MSEPFIAEIRMFAGNFAPRGWAFCNGSLLAISSNQSLFSLLGTLYGGDGRTTFGLPNLEGRAPMHSGRGPGLTDRRTGESGGQENVTLSVAQIPTHQHQVTGRDVAGIVLESDPEDNVWSRSNQDPYSDLPSSDSTMSSEAFEERGQSQPHSNQPPFLTLNFIIALTGLFPSRS